MDTEVYILALDVLSDAIKIIGPAAIIGYVAYMSGKSQHVLKLKELKTNNEFKAREKIFEFHKEKLTRNKETMDELSNGLGQFAGMTIADLGDELKLNNFINSFVSIYIEMFPFEIEYIKKEIEKYPNDFKQEKKRLEVICVDIEKIQKPTDTESVQKTIIELVKIYGFIGHCIEAIIEKEAMHIFKPYMESN